MASGSIFNISVDLSAFDSLQDELVPDFGILQQGIVDATRFVRDTWISAVTGTLLPGMMRQVNDDVYAKSLSTGESMSFPAPFYGVVMPINADEIIDRIEDGYGSYDMKPGLLNGPKSRPTADGLGRYNIVPFRHYTPTSSSPISIGLQMPTDVYKEAKKLNRTTQNQNGSIVWGEALDWDKQQRTSWTGYQHKNDIYHNMYRQGYSQHTQYTTFRRVSTPRTVYSKKGVAKQVGSAPNSWIHPGVSGNPVVQAVHAYCMPQVEEMLLKLAEKAFNI